MPRVKGKLIDRLVMQYGEEDGNRRYQAYKEKRRYQLSEQRYIDKYGEELGKQKYAEYRHKTNFIHGEAAFIEKYGEEDGRKRYRASLGNCRRTEESFKKKYGEDEGLKRWREYCEKQSITNTFEYKRDKYGWTKEQFDEYNKSRAVTLENLVRKYGEELGKKKWDSYCKKQAYTKSLQYFIDIYGEETGRAKFKEVTSKKVLTRENFIRKHGEKLGEEKWAEYKRNCSMIYSRASQELFRKIEERNVGHSLLFGSNEKRIVISGGKIASLDFYDETTKKAIEFYGDYFHANPTMFDSSHYFKQFGKTAAEIWAHDEARIEAIKKAGIDVKIIWESSKDDAALLEQLAEWVYSVET